MKQLEVKALHLFAARLVTRGKPEACGEWSFEVRCAGHSGSKM